MMQKLFLKCWYVTEIQKETHIDKDAFFENLLLEPEILQRELAEGAVLNILDERVKLTERQIGAAFTNDHKKEITKLSQSGSKVPKSDESDIRVLQHDVGKLFSNLYSQLGDIESAVMKAIDGQTVDQMLNAERLDLPSIIGEISDHAKKDEDDENTTHFMCFNQATCFAYQFLAGGVLLGIISYLSFREVNRKERPIALTNIGITLGISILWMLIVYYFITDILAYTFILGVLGVPLAYFIAQVISIFFLTSEPVSRPPELRTDERRRGKKGKRPRAEV